MEFNNPLEDDGLIAGAVFQQLKLGTCAGMCERDGLPPIVLDEALGYVVGGETEGATFVAVSDGKIRKSQDQGILVGGNEASLIEDPLQVRQKTKLLFSGRNCHRKGPKTAFSRQLPIT